jgi:hypothetical protein
MRHPMLLAAVLIALVAVVGCQSKAESASPAPAATSSEMAPKASTAPPAAGGEIGVAACDEYLDKWETCLATKVTGDAREQVKVALDASRDGWKRAAATPEGKAGLAAACQQAVELAKMQVAAYGCTW